MDSRTRVARRPHLDASSREKAVRAAARLAGMDKSVTCHTKRGAQAVRSPRDEQPHAGSAARAGGTVGRRWSGTGAPIPWTWPIRLRQRTGLLQPETIICREQRANARLHLRVIARQPGTLAV